MSTAIYVAIVEGSQDRGYSAFFPDLPGCVTAAETMVELPSAARDALSLHLEGMAEDGVAFPEPTALEDIKGDPEVKEVGRILVDAEVEDAPVRVNISIGGQFLKRVDVAAEARGMSRSGFLVEAARAAMVTEAAAVARSATDELNALVYDLDLTTAGSAIKAADAALFGKRVTFRPWLDRPFTCEATAFDRLARESLLSATTALMEGVVYVPSPDGPAMTLPKVKGFRPSKVVRY